MARAAQLPVSLYLALTLVAWSGPHHYVCICNLPLTLYGHLQLVPTAEYVYTTGFSHSCCLPWSLAMDMKAPH